MALKDKRTQKNKTNRVKRGGKKVGKKTKKSLRNKRRQSRRVGGSYIATKEGKKRRNIATSRIVSDAHAMAQGFYQNHKNQNVNPDPKLVRMGNIIFYNKLTKDSIDDQDILFEEALKILYPKLTNKKISDEDIDKMQPKVMSFIENAWEYVERIKSMEKDEYDP